jgi:hypothetical protein
MYLNAKRCGVRIADLECAGASVVQCAWRCHLARHSIRHHVQMYLKRLAEAAAAKEEERANIAAATAAAAVASSRWRRPTLFFALGVGLNNHVSLAAESELLSLSYQTHDYACDAQESDNTLTYIEHDSPEACSSPLAEGSDGETIERYEGMEALEADVRDTLNRFDRLNHAMDHLLDEASKDGVS